MSPGIFNMGKMMRRGRTSGAFTLVELLVVIAIIAVVAGLVVGVAAGSKQKKTRLQTQAEMKAIQAALELFKGKHGSYPPTRNNNPLLNPLFYELTGVRYTNPAPNVFVYTSVQDPGHSLTSVQVNSYFGTPGFMNFTTDPNANMEVWLPLRPKQYGKLNGTGPYLLKVPAKVPKVAATSVHSFTNLWKTNTENYWLYRAYDPNGFNPQGYDLWAELPGKDATQVEVVSSWGQQ